VTQSSEGTSAGKTGRTTVSAVRSQQGLTQAQGQVRPLSTVHAGERVHLVRTEAGRGLNSRLAAMGFVPGTQIIVVSNGHPGPFVIIVMDAKMILGRGVAHKIMVK
jgi:ferrous iron transport protein A